MKKLLLIIGVIFSCSCSDDDKGAATGSEQSPQPSFGPSIENVYRVLLMAIQSTNRDFGEKSREGYSVQDIRLDPRPGSNSKSGVLAVRFTVTATEARYMVVDSAVIGQKQKELGFEPFEIGRLQASPTVLEMVVPKGGAKQFQGTIQYIQDFGEYSIDANDLARQISFPGKIATSVASGDCVVVGEPSFDDFMGTLVSRRDTNREYLKNCKAWISRYFPKNKFEEGTMVTSCLMGPSRTGSPRANKLGKFEIKRTGDWAHKPMATEIWASAVIKYYPIPGVHEYTSGQFSVIGFNKAFEQEIPIEIKFTFAEWPLKADRDVARLPELTVQLSDYNWRQKTSFYQSSNSAVLRSVGFAPVSAESNFSVGKWCMNSSYEFTSNSDIIETTKDEGLSLEIPANTSPVIKSSKAWELLLRKSKYEIFDGERKIASGLLFFDEKGGMSISNDLSEIEIYGNGQTSYKDEDGPWELEIHGKHPQGILEFSLRIQEFHDDRMVFLDQENHRFVIYYKE